MKKFEVEVTRVDKYEIHVDEDVWTAEGIEDFENTFYDFYASDAEGVLIGILEKEVSDEQS
jgi:hypothetical protein